MALSVRLNPKTERALNTLARRQRLSRSEIVREAIVRYDIAEHRSQDSSRPYEAWFDVIGIINLGVRDPEPTAGEQFTAIVGKQVRARRPR